MKKGLIAAIVGGLVVLILGIWAVSSDISAHNTNVTKETALTAEYNANRATLGNYVNGLYESVSVANLKSSKLEAILSPIVASAIQGQYNLDKNNTADPNSLMNVMVRSVGNLYPQIGDLNIYDEIVTYVQAKRDAFAADQQKMQDMIRDYKAWRGQFPTSVFYPGADNNLVAIGPDGHSQVTGEQALTQMSLVIVPQGVNNSFGSGVGGPVQIPGAGN